MSPRQELYDALFMASQDLGYTTFQYLPPGQTPYPFVVINDVQMYKVSLKTAVQAHLVVTMHVWGDAESWTMVNDMLEQLESAAQRGFETKNYHFKARINDFDSQTVVDDSVPNTMLNHGLLTLSFVLS